MEIDRWGDRKDLGLVGGGETVIRICYMKNCFFLQQIFCIYSMASGLVFLLDS